MDSSPYVSPGRRNPPRICKHVVGCYVSVEKVAIEYGPGPVRAGMLALRGINGPALLVGQLNREGRRQNSLSVTVPQGIRCI